MNLKNKVIAAVAGATMLGGAITTVIQKNEGYSETAYQDPAGIWSICYGETKGVQKGLRASTASCDAQLRESIASHAESLVQLPEGLPDVVVLGAVDMIYNVGVAGFKNSLISTFLKQADYRQAGEAVLAWKYITRNGKKYDCSQLVQGKPNKVCWGLWERRQWQSKAIGNQYKTVQEAVEALPK